MRSAEKYNIQLIWDLIHFGYPDNIYPTHPLFCERFTALCRAFASFYKENSKQQLFVVPINEISFLSWHSGDVRGTAPFAVNSGWDIKYHLCKAAIQGIKALKTEDPDCIIVLVEPLVKIHEGENDTPIGVWEANENQYQAMDIIAGRMCPELGGSEDFLDILGFNYYWNCQWLMNGEPLEWPDINGNRMPLSDLLSQAYKRYKKPIFLSETGHFGSGRVQWLEDIVAEGLIAKNEGVDLNGICIYPVTDRPDWDDVSKYCNCGIWDLDENGNRIPHDKYIDSIKKAQEEFKEPTGILESVLQFFNTKKIYLKNEISQN
jgi:beta-glucosidase/6-phospho-beta-glucosidase/beta-galactosidase